MNDKQNMSIENIDNSKAKSSTNHFFSSKRNVIIIAAVLLIAIMCAVYFIAEHSKKEDLINEAEIVAREFGFTDARASIDGKESGIYTGLIICDGFGDLSFDEMFEIAEKMPAGALFTFADGGKFYDVYTSPNTIYKNYQQIYPNNDTVTDSEKTDDDSGSNSNSVTTGEKNALKSAKAYLGGSSGFSEEGLRNQLDYEGYETSEIDYAIENCGADWQEQCKICAQNYLNSSMAFSKQGLIDQLVYEGFDTDMATEVVEEVYQ